VVTYIFIQRIGSNEWYLTYLDAIFSVFRPGDLFFFQIVHGSSLYKTLSEALTSNFDLKNRVWKRASSKHDTFPISFVRFSPFFPEKNVLSTSQVNMPLCSPGRAETFITIANFFHV
jgi:hypothetical protein